MLKLMIDRCYICINIHVKYYGKYTHNRYVHILFYNNKNV